MQNLVNFVTAHQAEIAFGVYAILCEVFAFNKKAESNSVLQFIFKLAKSKKGNIGE